MHAHITDGVESDLERDEVRHAIGCNGQRAAA